MQSGLLRILFGSLLVMAIVWSLILAWWQSNDASPSQGEMALYLLGIPLALIVGYLLLRGFLEHLRKPVEAEQAEAGAAADDDDPLARARPAGDAAERSYTLCLLASRLRVSVGTSADDVLGAVGEGKRPEPSDTLIDGEGFPAFAAAVADLDTGAVAERLREAYPDLREALQQPPLVRALAMQEEVLADLLGEFDRLREECTGEIRLQAVWLLPESWNPAWIPALRQYLKHSLETSQGESDVLCDVLALQARNDADTLRHLDALILRSNRDPLENEFLLVLGAASAVDEAVVAQWAGDGRLFSAKQQQGMVPGEGSAALLLTARPTVDRLKLEKTVEFTRVSHGVRDKRLDAGGRVGGKLIAALYQAVLDATATAPETINAVVLDADHRAAHMTEAMEGFGESLAHLDPLKDVLPVCLVAGSLTPVGSLLALACAGARCLAETAPVICLSNHHELDRALLLARPLDLTANNETSSS